MAADLIPAERQGLILRLLAEREVVTVAELRGLLQVSEITVRRDLALLESRGFLERTHGGAVGSRRVATEPLYTEKYEEHRREKLAIGKAAAGLVQRGETLLINSGSTTLAVIKHLAKEHLRVFTSNAGALSLPLPPDVELNLLGGLYRAQSNSLVGPFSAHSLELLYGTRAIIGVDGISSKYGLTTPAQQEAEVARLMIERTRGPVVVVADHSKIGAVSNFVTASIEAVDLLVTDDGLNDEYRSELESVGLRILLVPMDSPAATEV